MTMDEVITITNNFLVEEFEVDMASIKPAAPVKETLELDSLDYVDLVVLIDTHFGFKVQQQDFKGIVTFQDFYNFLHQRVK
ncbi:MAG: phosphopantetheine-binding protein [Bacteroidota bacterium]